MRVKSKSIPIFIVGVMWAIEEFHGGRGGPVEANDGYGFPAFHAFRAYDRA